MSEDNRVPPKKNKEAFKRCIDALPFYVAGTLPKHEQSWLEDYLLRNMSLKRHLKKIQEAL